MVPIRAKSGQRFASSTVGQAPPLGQRTGIARLVCAVAYRPVLREDGLLAPSGTFYWGEPARAAEQYRRDTRTRRSPSFSPPLPLPALTAGPAVINHQVPRSSLEYSLPRRTQN